MWKQLFAVVAGLGLAAGAATAQTDSPPDPPPADEPPQYALGVLPGRGSGLHSLDAEGFRGAIFATPLPGRAVVPAGATLAAPVILPAGEKHGDLLYDVMPVGEPGHFDPATTRHPGNYLRGRPWVWGSAEALFGMTSAVNVPPVVTTGPAAAGIVNAGAIGQPGTVPLFGGRQMLDTWRTGVRGEAGVWFDSRHVWGASARFYSLFSTSDQFVGGGTGLNVLNLPQFVPVAGAVIQIPAPVGFPGVTVGRASATAQTTFAGGDLALRRVLLPGSGGLRLEALAGYRQMHLGDELGAGFRIAAAGGDPVTAPLVVGDDGVRTRNNFYGAQLGGQGAIAAGRWTLQGTTVLALGVTASDLDFTRTRLASPGGAVLVPIAQTTSGGRVNYFGVVSEGGVKLAFRVTPHARLTFGYTGMYWWNVRRAQEQFTLSPTLTGGRTTFYTHSLSWGGEFRF